MFHLRRDLSREEGQKATEKAGWPCNWTSFMRGNSACG